MPPDRLSHLDEQGRAHMVDVSAKPATARRAVAEGRLRLAPATLARVFGGGLAKGDALAVARLAGIQGAKRTPDLVPLCHPVRLDQVVVDLAPDEPEHVRVTVTAAAVDRTGVEMEALTAVCAACLALYDMVKGVDRSAEIVGVRLLSKEGGRSGTWTRELAQDGDKA
jgi:cyclic pyranopterin phosphate synthase